MTFWTYCVAHIWLVEFKQGQSEAFDMKIIQGEFNYFSS